VSRETGIFCFTSAAGITNNAAGSTKIRSAPYNFPYAGGVYNSSLSDVGSYSVYWSRTAHSVTSAYDLDFNSSGVYLANGRSIRCVATSS